MFSIDYIFILILIICVTLSILSHKLAVSAALVGGGIACFIFIGSGYVGIIMLAAFFIAGSAATSWKMDIKQQTGFAEKNKGKRTAAQVAANAGLAALLGLNVLIFPEYVNLFQVMIAAAFASATADTLSSELGFVYGKNFYNILTFKTDARGSDGVVSVEGLLIGIAGSVLIAIIYSIGFVWNKNFMTIIIAGTAGNIADSVLGAAFERKDYLQNNAVNFLNTFIAALIALLLLII